MEALIEAISSLVTLAAETLRLMLSGLSHALNAMLNPEKRHDFQDQWQSSKMFRLGVILSAGLFLSVGLGMVVLFNRFYVSPPNHVSHVSPRQENPQQVSAMKPKPTTEENANVSLSFENSKGQKSSIHIDTEMAKSMWGKTKKLFSKDKNEEQ
jgi:hypothetical protein